LFYFNSNCVEFLTHPGAIGIDNLADEELVPYRNYFSYFHQNE